MSGSSDPIRRTSGTRDRVSSWRRRRRAPRPRRPAASTRGSAACPFGRPLAIGGGDQRASAQEQGASRSSARTRSQSSAYATEEILRVLVLAGSGGAPRLDPVAIAHRHPALGRLVLLSPGVPRLPIGGGAYIVARENIGPGRRARRGRGTAHRLRHDGGGLDGFRRRPGLLRLVPALTTSGSRSPWRRSPSSPSPTSAASASQATSSRSRPTCSSGLALLMVAIGLSQDRHRGCRTAPDSRPGDPRSEPPRDARSIAPSPRRSRAASVALTGIEAIANGVPGVQAAGVEERREHDVDDGRPARCPVRRDHDRRR